MPTADPQGLHSAIYRGYLRTAGAIPESFLEEVDLALPRMKRYDSVFVAGSAALAMTEGQQLLQSSLEPRKKRQASERDYKHSSFTT